MNGNLERSNRCSRQVVETVAAETGGENTVAAEKDEEDAVGAMAVEMINKVPRLYEKRQG